MKGVRHAKRVRLWAHPCGVVLAPRPRGYSRRIHARVPPRPCGGSPLLTLEVTWGFLSSPALLNPDPPSTMAPYPLKRIWGGGGHAQPYGYAPPINGRSGRSHPALPALATAHYHDDMASKRPAPAAVDPNAIPDPTSDTALQAKPRRHRSEKGPRFHPDDPVPDHPNLTVQGLICLYIRKGAFSHIAAMAAGIPEGVFHDWLKAAEGKHSRRFRKFKDAVMQAEAQARVKAELAVFEANPRAWLREGPGRHQGSRVGWSVPVPGPSVTNQMQVNIQHSPEWSALWSEILARAAPFPEARAALADALRDMEQRPVASLLQSKPVPVSASGSESSPQPVVIEQPTVLGEGSEFDDAQGQSAHD